MSELKICRICLRTEAKMYHFNLYQLKFYYEEVMALKVQTNEEEGLPHHFCYECATLLHKFHKFKEKCYVGQKVLKDLLWRGPITYESIYKVNRKEAMLTSPLAIMTVSKRVKTYTTTDTREHEQYADTARQIVENIEKIELDYFSETSLTDREDNINELIDEEKICEDVKIQFDGTKITCDDDQLEFDDEKISCSGNETTVDKEKVICDEEKISFEVPLDAVNSPMVVYVEGENGVTKTVCEKIKERRKNKSKKGSNSWKLKALQDETKWKVSVLSEEDALKEFRARAEDKKYLAAAFKCTDCFRGFSKKDMLDRHTQLRHIEQVGSFECRFCRYRYRLDCYVKKHMKQHFTRYECMRCHLVCQLENTAILHEEYHSGVTRKCTYCDEEFRHSSTYYTHLRTHRSEHVCTLCGASFVSKLGLHQHKHVKHVIIEIDSPDDDEEVNTFCQRCDIRFETRKAFEEHLFHSALHSEEEGRKINEVELKDDDEDNSRESPEKVSASKKVLGKKEQAKITRELRKRNNVDDPFCNKLLMERKRLKKKERRQRTKPTTCHQCGEHFETQAACLKHHIEAHPRTSFHPPNERYICEICGSSLAPGSIATHQNMHTREKVHTCDTCGRQFHAIIGLKRHLVTHTGEKPYACPLCDKRFTQSNSMKLHYRTFHLKQPYPKRNRRTKKDEPKETAGGESNSEDSSDDSLPDIEPRDQPGIEPVTDVPAERPDESMHYLTLT